MGRSTFAALPVAVYHYYTSGSHRRQCEAGQNGKTPDILQYPALAPSTRFERVAFRLGVWCTVSRDVRIITFHIFSLQIFAFKIIRIGNVIRISRQSFEEWLEMEEPEKEVE